MERINVRVESKLKQQLELEAQEKGVSPSDIVRQALQEHLQRQKPRESCYDIAKRLGIIGSAKGLPSDLSTNPKHMEGFGLD
jgi:metal-responsive CopG/Arc/MetJ family transcriptional regulator